MVPRAANTRDKILDLAEAFLQERGFNGFSYQHIATELDIKNAAIHYHFPNKADLGVALIERFQHRFLRFTAKLTNVEPREKLDGYFGISINYLRYGARVCPLGVLEAEYHAIPDTMQAAIKAFDKSIRDWLSQVLKTGREAKQFAFNCTPEQKALVILAALQGALQMARVGGKRVFFDTLRQLRQDLIPANESQYT